MRTVKQLNSPGWHLIRHHDIVISVGHQQPKRLLQNVFNEMLPFSVSRHFGLRFAAIRAAFTPELSFPFEVMLQRVDAAKVLAGVAASCTQVEKKKGI